MIVSAWFARDLAKPGVARRAGRPEQQRRRLQAVDARLGVPDVRALFGLRAQRDELERGRVEAPRQVPRRLDRDLPRPRRVVENRAERGPVVRGKRLEHRLRGDPRTQPLGERRRPGGVARVARRRRREPEHADPIAAGPVAVGRRGPPARLGICPVREALLHLAPVSCTRASIRSIAWLHGAGVVIGSRSVIQRFREAVLLDPDLLQHIRDQRRHQHQRRP